MKINFWKLGLAILVSIYFFRYALHPMAGYFIDNANLLIHEAGHFVFGGFGRTMMFLGGSLLQILVPIIFVGYFLYSGQYFSGALALFWVGENIINVSVYIGDAQVRILPLLNGDFSSHDWYNLLGGFNLLPQTGIISQIVYFTGVVILLLAAILAIKFSFKSQRLEIIG